MTSVRARSIVDVRAELHDYAAALDADDFAPWVGALVRYVAELIGRCKRVEAEALTGAAVRAGGADK